MAFWVVKKFIYNHFSNLNNAILLYIIVWIQKPQYWKRPTLASDLSALLSFLRLTVEVIPLLQC